MLDETAFEDLKASVADAKRYMDDKAMKPFSVLYSRWIVNHSAMPVELYRERPIRYILGSGGLAYLLSICEWTQDGSFALLERNGEIYRLTCEHNRLIWYRATWERQD